jgi:two-component system, sensor histidine kinase and response regulator
MSKILIIDDQKSVRRCIVDVFKHVGIEVTEAENGVVGIQMAQQYLPDLVISDVTMPELDGYGVLKQLRSNPETATIPLIFLTAWNDRENLRRGMELGADDYLTKPFVVSELLATAHTQIEKRHELIARSEERLEHLRDNITLALPHELRTPLTSILGFAEMLMTDDQPLNDTQIRFVAEHIHRGQFGSTG